jgi:hypothetical protein
MSGDFKRRSEEFRKRLNETAAERQKRIQHSTNKAEMQTRTATESTAMFKKGDIIQLTLPVWFREKQRETFKESDPEWQSFLDLQKDDKRMADLKSMFLQPDKVQSLTHLSKSQQSCRPAIA